MSLMETKPTVCAIMQHDSNHRRFCFAWLRNYLLYKMGTFLAEENSMVQNAGGSLWHKDQHGHSIPIMKRLHLSFKNFI